MISRSRFASGPKYLGFWGSSSFCPIVNDTTLYGPVPVGWLNPYEPVALNAPFEIEPWSAPYLFIAVGLCIANAWSTSQLINVPVACVRFTTAVELPLAAHLLYSGAES